MYQKIKTYNLDYSDGQGNPKPVKFVSYIWKLIDGFIIDSLKKEVRMERRAKPETSDSISGMAFWCRPFASTLAGYRR